MPQHAILFPVFALVALTFGIGIWLGKLRFGAVIKGELSTKFYALNKGAEMPEYITKVSHNYDNLLALPILFYVLAILLLITDKAGTTQIILAWLFVATRYVHSYVHTTYNNVRHRMRAFLLSVIVLITMWCVFFVSVI